MTNLNSQHTAQDIEALLVQLSELLEIERQALKARDLELLQSNTEAKEALVTELKQMATRSAANRPGDPTDPQGELIHKSMLDLARRVRDSNLVNGKILHRSQQSVREAINVLSGKTLDGLYGHSGQPTAENDANQEIAKA